MDTVALVKEAAALAACITAYRRALHAMPELKMDTPLTEAYIAEQLTAMGVEEVHTGIGGHGVTAVIHGSSGTVCTAIRADCDGLPIVEETGLPFASVNGCMHACGHDAHTAMALGAARLLIAHTDALEGSVKLIFQPYEEGDGGAKAMIADGALDGVDEIIAMHTGNIMGQQYVSGDVIIPGSASSANIWAFRVRFTGKSAHVCKPDDAVNPVCAAAEAITRIEREVAVLREQEGSIIAAVTVVHAGVRNNIIPYECMIEGSLRAFDPEVFDKARKDALRIFSQCAQARGADCEVETVILLSGIQNDSRMLNAFRGVASRMLPPDRIKRLDPPVYMGEDFARYSDRIPGLYFFLCSRQAGNVYPHHHPKFDIDESTLPVGAALLAGYVLFGHR